MNNPTEALPCVVTFRLGGTLFAVPVTLVGETIRLQSIAVLPDALVGVVRAMDRGALTSKDALEAFARHRVPGFSFGRWLVEMVDEDVCRETVFNEAA